MKVIVSKKFDFEAAHYLPNYSGKCRQLHGHHWVVEVACSGEILSNGMVIDFTKLKVFTEGIKNIYDHSLINSSTHLHNPTAENIADDILVSFIAWLPKNIRWEYIKVWESEDSCVEILRSSLGSRSSLLS